MNGYEMTDDQFEAVRDKFFKVANIDLKNLGASEIRGLMALLPHVHTALLHYYDMGYVFGEEDED